MNWKISLYFTLLVLILPLLLFTRYHQVSVKTSQTDIRDGERFHITPEEKENVRVSTSQTLTWIANWHAPLACEDSDFDLKQYLKQFEAKEIKALLEASRTCIYVTLDDLHIRIKFVRIGTGEVGFLDDQRYCESSFEKHAARLQAIQEELAVKAKAEGVKTAAEIVNEAKDKLAKLGIPSKPEEELSENITYREPTPFLIPPQDKNINQPVDHLNESEPAKRTLYRAILQAISTDKRFTCEPGSNIHLKIPGFELGDPGIYIEVNERGGWHTDSGVSVVYMGFGRDRQTGAFKITDVRLIGLMDEVDFFTAKIKERRRSEENVLCGSIISQQ
jgi:hypothetical protein